MIILVIALWFSAAWLAIGVLATVSQVGKPRAPLTAGIAVVSVLVGTLIAISLVLAALTIAGI